MTAELLRHAEILNADENGLRVKGKLNRLHAASSGLLNYNVHEKRGKEAMDAAGILGGFSGTAVHDHRKSYFGYKNSGHALCDAHHLRGLLSRCSPAVVYGFPIQVLKQNRSALPDTGS